MKYHIMLYVVFLFLGMAIGFQIMSSDKPTQPIIVTAKHNDIRIEAERFQRHILYLAPKIRLVVTIEPLWYGEDKPEHKVSMEIQRYDKYFDSDDRPRWRWWNNERIDLIELQNELHSIRSVDSPFADDRRKR